MTFMNQREIDNNDNTDSLFKFALFSAEQREQHGKILASTHQIIPGRSCDRLLARLDENESSLLEIHQLLVLDIEADRQMTMAGEWLLDLEVRFMENRDDNIHFALLSIRKTITHLILTDTFPNLIFPSSTLVDSELKISPTLLPFTLSPQIE